MNNGLTIQEIIDITGAAVTGEDILIARIKNTENYDVRVRNILTDSRQFQTVQTPNETLFVALRTAKNDGHNYINTLYDKGVHYFLVQKDYVDRFCTWAIFIRVENPLTALQQIAAARRKLFNIPVLAITGSNGKTVVKEWISTMLRVDKKVVSSPKSYNSQIGVPLSVWQIKEGDEFAVFEAGISEPNEMSALQKVINPTIGIFTNIGTAHDEYFPSVANKTAAAQKTAEKLKLFKDVSLLIYCADYPQIKEQLQLSLPHLKTLSWAMGKDVEADIKISSINSNIEDKTSVITAIYKEKKIEIEIPFVDSASIENAIHCWVFMLSQGYDNAEIAKRINLLLPIEMRMEMKEGINHCFIINDFYNSDYSSFLIALDYLSNQHQNKFRRIILSDILQSGRSDKDLYKDIASVLQKKEIDAIIGIGKGISSCSKVFGSLKSAEFFRDTESFLKQAKAENFNRETILLKGARAFGFERISQFFQKEVHQTVFEINLNAIIHNLNVFRSLLGQTKVMLMTKAFSYGSGSYEVAQTLQYHNADYLAVAYADEGVQLRENGVSTPIMVMNPEEQGLESVLQHDLEPQIYSMAMLQKLRSLLLAGTYAYYDASDDVYDDDDDTSDDAYDALGDAWGYSTSPSVLARDIVAVKIHIKLNTGMNRLGFDKADIPQLLQILKSDKRIKVASILTHLATADDPRKDKYTLAQIKKFDSLSSKIAAVLPYKVLRHCLNTAGIIRFPQYQFDMVRLGIGLYGVAPIVPIADVAGISEVADVALETVGTLKTVISQIHTIKKGEAVGYGRKFTAKQPSRIGVIGIGYADGYSRKLGNGVGQVLVRGKRVSIIGNVCMDMCMVDLTSVPEAKEQDEVIIFGKEITVNEIAEKLGTIPYEILTSVSSRVKRIYYQE